MSFDERIQKLNEVSRGWVNAYRLASIQIKLAELDGWLRNRLRYCIWHHWKSLIRKGVALSDWVLNKDKPMHGVVHVWEDGQLLRVRYLALPLH